MGDPESVQPHFSRMRPELADVFDDFHGKFFISARHRETIISIRPLRCVKPDGLRVFGGGKTTPFKNSVLTGKFHGKRHSGEILEIDPGLHGFVRHARKDRVAVCRRNQNDGNGRVFQRRRLPRPGQQSGFGTVVEQQALQKISTGNNSFQSHRRIGKFSGGHLEFPGFFRNRLSIRGKKPYSLFQNTHRFCTAADMHPDVGGEFSGGDPPAIRRHAIDPERIGIRRKLFRAQRKEYLRTCVSRSRIRSE
ncbi:MAG: hypothetical protein BWY31_02914 [Lentisphaerae bacterium ADurb.Bin242]|nr:MAG: hypothetical protein BWY31_02914 [Lentisphaerae bacterium ADurb.Bin242]